MRIAIASGKGGAGKTSVAASLASVWDSPLVAVDTDVEAPNLHLFLPPQVEGSSKAWLEVPSLDLAACSKCGKCREICSFKAIASFAGNISIFPDMCHGCGGCFAVCADKALKPVGRELGELEHGAVLDGTVRFLMGRTRIGESMTPPLLRQLRARLDAMLAEIPADAILDAPPGVSCPAVTVTRDVDLILLVADPTPFGFHDFRLAHQAFLPLNKAMAVVINRAGAEGNADGDAAVRDYCRKHGLPLLAELPFERAAAEQYANGRLLAALSPEWKQRFEHLRDALRRAHTRFPPCGGARTTASSAARAGRAKPRFAPPLPIWPKARSSVTWMWMRPTCTSCCSRRSRNARRSSRDTAPGSVRMTASVAASVPICAVSKRYVLMTGASLSMTIAKAAASA